MIQVLLPWAADLLVILGLVIMSVTIYGMVWMPDIYNRVHAASKSVALGAIPILLASAVTGDPAIISRVILIVIFLLLTTPVSAHAISRTAYLEGAPMKAPSIDETGRLPAEMKSES